MQPWLDFDPRETGCRRCGRALEGGDVRIWACRERTRRFDFDAGRAAGSGRIRYGEVSRAYPVCTVCHEALERGEPMGRSALVKLVVVAAAAGVLCLAGGPLAHRWAPNFAAAFWRNGALGR